MEIRRYYDRLISTMGFPILVRWHLYIESGPWILYMVQCSKWIQYGGNTIWVTGHLISPVNWQFPKLTVWVHNDDDVIKWKHFPHHCTFVRGIHRSPVNSPHKGQWCRALMFSLICTWTNGWVNNRYADDLRCQRAHYDFTVMMMETSNFRITD